MEQPHDFQCQIHSMPLISLPFRAIDRIGYFLKRAKRFLKRRWNFLINSLRHRRTCDSKRAQVIEIDQSHEQKPGPRPETLQPGDIVRIKSRQEIKNTLDNWNQSRGCAFMEEMWRFCGSVQKVRKCVRKFLDERDYRVKKCRGIVILEGITCEGTKDFGDCDRSCFFFWREEWLEKVSQENTLTEQIEIRQTKNVQSSRSE